ncbi:uncharacterized protein LOC128191572 [Crassostrea angulata]|uniref:uncharacterized protein LOC128191572 n=1 Tax=Magallana angulata TaxID=2784310 RepID=UPI0022B20E3E|nr:uncharacterized protein LOC128191572 [Crassostrea angulata]
MYRYWNRKLPMQRTESVCIFIFLIGLGHIYGYIEISSDSNYLQLSTFCLNAGGRGYVEFWVNASTDVHVALMTQDLSTPRDDWSQFYEIVIGGQLNQMSCIRALRMTCEWIESPGILNSADYVQLWISWYNNTIRLGKGSRADDIIVVSHPQSIQYDVNYLAVMTHYTSSWRFYEDTDCRFEEFNNTNIITNKTRCNEVTNYTCVSGYELTSGNLNRVCGIGRQWIGDPPVCSAMPLCPEKMSTSSVTVLSQHTQIGGILSMTCAPHHALLIGNLLRTCLPNATWDGTEPVCEACLCPSAAVGYQFNSTDELITKMDEMKKELKVEREKTNAYIRSKISVKDNRTSSTRIGYVLGCGIIGSLLMAICLCDAAPLLRHIRHGV